MKKFANLSVEKLMSIMGLTSKPIQRHQLAKVLADKCKPISDTIYWSLASNKGVLIDVKRGLAYSYFTRDYVVEERGGDLVLIHLDTFSSAVVYCGESDRINDSLPGLKLESGEKDGYPIVWFKYPDEWLRDSIEGDASYVMIKVHHIIYLAINGYKTLCSIGSDRPETIHHLMGIEAGNSIDNLDMMPTRDHDALPKRRK